MDAWTASAEASAYEPHKILSVGILLGETEEWITLALNMDISGDDVSCVMSIPVNAVKYRKDLCWITPHPPRRKVARKV